jgi:trans-aconitate methyltransferase
MDRSDNFYAGLLEHFGHSHKAVGWSTLESQQARFQALAECANWEGKSVLDVGCGLGDLYDFIKRHYPNTKYTGFDELSSLIEQAKIAYPSGTFIQQSLEAFPKEKKYDCVVACGVFNLRQDGDQFQFLHKQVSRLTSLAKEVTAISLLSNVMYKNQTFSKKLFYYDAETVKEVLKEMGDITIMDGYLENDFTLVIRS